MGLNDDNLGVDDVDVVGSSDNNGFDFNSVAHCLAHIWHARKLYPDDARIAPPDIPA